MKTLCFLMLLSLVLPCCTSARLGMFRRLITLN